MQKNKVEIVVEVDSATGEARIKGLTKAMDKAGHEGSAAFNKAGRAASHMDSKLQGATVSAHNLLNTYMGYQAVTAVMRSITNEVKTGLESVNDFKLSVATMTGFMITNSQKLKEGDLAGAYRDANTYAAKLIPKLEVIAAQTLGTGKDLQAITETMMMHGVVLDINNKKEVKGLKNITNVLKMVTAGQNQDIQMRQEINGLMTGQIRMQDRLATMLKAVDPNLKEHLRLWKQQGTIIEHVGALLAGFDPATKLVEATWTSIGSTMETINTKVLRGGMLPIFNDLMAKAKEINSLFMDKDGHLTEFSYTIQDNIHHAWDYAKDLGGELKGLAFAPGTAEVIKTLGVLVGSAAGIKALTALGMGVANVSTGGLTAIIAALSYQLYNGGGKLADSTLSGNHISTSMDDIRKTMAYTGKVLSNERMIALEAAKAKTNGRPGMVRKIPELSPAHLKQRHLETEAEWQAKVNAKLAKHNALLRAAATSQKSLDAITLAALPANAQAVERVNRQYDKYREQLDALADSGDITLNQEIELWDGLDKQQQTTLDNLKENGNSAADDLKNAFSGWGNSFADDLNNALWTADNTFGDIALSFAKMLTKMAIQKEIAKPLVNSMLSSETGNWLASIFHEGGVVGGPAPARAVSPAVFTGAPRFHSGLLPDEFPAILQRGETVVPRGGFGRSSAPQTVSVEIHNDGNKKKAADTEVHFDARGFVVEVFLQDMDSNGPIKQAMAGGAL